MMKHPWRVVGFTSLAVAVVLLSCGAAMSVAAGGDFLLNGSWRWETSTQGTGVTSQQSKDITADITTVTLDISAANVTITTGDFPQLTAALTSSRGSALNISGGDGALDVTIKQPGYSWFGLWSGTDTDTVNISLPETYKGTLAIDAAGCQVTAAQLSQVSAVRLDGNATSVKLSGLTGALTAHVNAADSQFAFAALNGDVSIQGNMCNIKVSVPQDAGFSVSEAGNMVSFHNVFGEAYQGDGAHAIRFSGNMCNFLLLRADGTAVS